MEAHALQRARTPGCVSRMTAWDDQDLHASSSSEPVPEVTTAQMLKSWSSIKELHARLRELGAPIYGTKDVLFRRLCEW